MNGESRCTICRRTLRDPISIARGIGPVCLSKMKRGASDGGSLIADEYLGDTMIPNIILKRAEDGRVQTNVPHLVAHHSPTGFEYGYSGSGPNDLALNICEALLRQQGYKGAQMECWRGKCFEAAWALHVPFRDKFIAPLPREGGNIPYKVAQSWIMEKMQQGGWPL